MAKRGPKPKVGDYRMIPKIKRLREKRFALKAKHAEQLHAVDLEIARALKAYQESGASLNLMCEAYGTKDKRTVLNLLARLEGKRYYNDPDPE